MHQHVGLVARLRIVELGADVEAGGAPRQIVFPRQLTHQIHHLCRFRRAAHRRPRFHVHRHHELAIDDGRARADQLGEGNARQRLGIDLRHSTHGGSRSRRATQREGRADDGLVVRGIDLHRIQHGGVPHQRRIAVGDRYDHRVVLHIVLAEHDARHLHHVLRPLLRGDDAHEGLVGVGQRRVDDVQVALRHRDLHRLDADRARGMQGRQHVGQLVEVVEVLKRAIAAHIVEVAHIRRAIHWHEDLVLPAHLDGALRVAGIEGEFGRCRGNQAHQQRAINPHTRAGDAGAGRLPHGDRLVVAEFAAHLLEDLHRFIVDQLHRLVGHEVVDGNLAHQRGEGRHGRGAQRPPPVTPAAAAA